MSIPLKHPQREMNSHVFPQSEYLHLERDVGKSKNLHDKAWRKKSEGPWGPSHEDSLLRFQEDGLCALSASCLLVSVQGRVSQGDVKPVAWTSPVAAPASKRTALHGSSSLSWTELCVVRAPPLTSGDLLWQLAQSLTPGGLQDLVDTLARRRVRVERWRRSPKYSSWPLVVNLERLPCYWQNKSGPC